MKTILSYLKQYKKESILAPLFKMLEALFELFVPLVISAIIDKGIANKDIPYITKMCLLLIMLAIIGLACSITAQYFAARAAVGTSAAMRHSLFEHIQSFSFSQMDKAGTSTLITRLTSDINQVQNGINLVLRLFLRSPFIVFGAMIMAFTIDVKSALIFLFAIPALSAVVFGIMLVTRPLYKKVQLGLDRILGITRENLTGVRVIRAFNKQEQEKEEFRQANDSLTAIQKYAGKISGFMNPLTYIIINTAIIVLIWVGALRVNSGLLTQGQVVALYNYMSQILIELIKLANLIVSITKALACARRITDVMEMEPGMEEGTYEDGIENAPYAVEFKNVSLKYNDAGAEALTGISFKVKRGQTIGIIGGTGSGKSSLVNLIPRFYDATEGQVLVDGRDVKQYTYNALHRRISVVLQKVQLFKGTIKDNVALGGGNISDAEIERALEISQAKEFVDRKEGRLNASVEQGGRNLSGGQRQRLTIARALAKNAQILILDDSASALDFATDAKLRKAIAGMESAPTVFIVSQRASSIMHADQIIVLDDGSIAGLGTHQQLLEDCSVYQEIYNSQFRKEA